MNIVAITGRATKDPITSYTTSQTAVVKFNLAVQRPMKGTGADFPSIVAFGKTAENIEKYVHKGDMVGITGHIQTSTYEKNGEKVYSTDVVVDRIDFLNSKANTDSPTDDNPTDGFSKLTNEDIPFED